MAHPQRVTMKWPFLAMSVIFTVAVAASTAHAEGYGELTRFGEAGSGVGKLNSERTRALGVDPRDNSVYVLDEPEPPTQHENKEGEFILNIRHLRLQKFSPAPAGSNHYLAVASVSFNETAPGAPFEGEGGEARAVEGIVIDPNPARERVYVLADDLRQGEKALPDDIEAPVASTLFAFSTTPQECGKEGGACKLVPAKGTKEIEIVVGKVKETERAVLAGPGATELGAQSAAAGKPLLGPAGMTIDPVTGEVIILGHIDPVGEPTDELENEEGPDHFVLQRILPNGQLGKRFVDKANVLKARQINGELVEGLRPDSPIVVSASGTPHVYVSDAGLVEVPYNFSETPPSVFSGEHQGGALEGQLASEHGAQVSVGVSTGPAYAPEGPIYVGESIRNAAVGHPRRGLLALSGQDGSELGWSGGQALQSTIGVGCVIQGPGLSVVSEANVSPMAAGSEGKLFVLDREFLEPIEAALYPAVIEFGPGGSGCPAASATAPVAKVNEQIVETVQPGQEVTLSSNLTQADALKVEWEFGDGTTQTVPPSGALCLGSEAPQCPHVQHSYASEGTYTVTEKIYHDDLASVSPIVQTGRVVVAGVIPTALASGPLTVVTNQPAELDGSASSEPSRGPNQIRGYHWVFGDGQRESKTEPTVKHAYTKPGFYTVSLTVTDAAGRTSLPYTLPRPVAVIEPVIFGEEIHGPTQGAVSGRGLLGGGVASSKAGTPVPDVRLASSSLRVNRAGSVRVTVSCPAAERSCAGTLTLRTLATLVVRHSAKAKRKFSILTLARASFALNGGRRETITLHLSATARSLLASKHVLRARLTILAHDPAGVSHASQAIVGLRG